MSKKIKYTLEYFPEMDLNSQNINGSKISVKFYFISNFDI